MPKMFRVYNTEVDGGGFSQSEKRNTEVCMVDRETLGTKNNHGKIERSRILRVEDWRNFVRERKAYI